MRVVVLGATGQTGLQLVKAALEGHHEVVAVVRDPERLKDIKNEQLYVVKGDIFSEENLKLHFRGADTVFSCLGFKRTSTVTGYSDSIRHIVAAARETNINRLVLMTAYYTETSVAANQGIFVRWLLIPMLRPILTNMREMEKYLDTNCSDMNYTVVRPPGLTNGKVSGKPIKVELDAFYLKGTSGPTRMSRADVAKYMLDCIPNTETYKKAVAIGL